MTEQAKKIAECVAKALDAKKASDKIGRAHV